MKEEKFTHLAKIYGFKCYFNSETMEVVGTNWFNDKLIDFCVFLETTFPINSQFEITILEELEK